MKSIDRPARAARIAFACVLAAASAARAAEQPLPAADDGSPWRFSIQGSYRYGPVSGYVQTPAGGEPGTTSKNRPRLSEAGIDDASTYDVSLNADYRAEEVYVGAQFIGLSGSDTLGDDALVSHGVTFPAGSRLSESTDLNWYRVGYRHRFDLLGDGSLTLSPGVGVDFLDFSTRLSGGGTTTSRSYIKPGVQLALATEWRPNDGPFSLELDLLGSPGQFQSLAAIFSEELVAKYRFVDRGRVQVGGFVGVGFEQIRFEDSQRTPNRINVDLGPSLIVGVSVAF